MQAKLRQAHACNWIALVRLFLPQLLKTWKSPLLYLLLFLCFASQPPQSPWFSTAVAITSVFHGFLTLPFVTLNRLLIPPNETWIIPSFIIPMSPRIPQATLLLFSFWPKPKWITCEVFRTALNGYAAQLNSFFDSHRFSTSVSLIWACSFLLPTKLLAVLAAYLLPSLVLSPWSGSGYSIALPRNWAPMSLSQWRTSLLWSSNAVPIKPPTSVLMVNQLIHPLKISYRDFLSSKCLGVISLLIGGLPLSSW